MKRLTQTSLVGFASALIIVALGTAAHGAIAVTNGDFENPDVGTAQVQNITDWFDSTGNFTSWQQSDDSSGGSSSGSQAGVFGQGNIGWMYQSIGTLSAGATTLDYAFDQVTFLAGNSGSGMDLRFFSGTPGGTPADGTDIDALTGLTQIGSTISYATTPVSTNTARSGSVDVSALAAGTQVWIDFTSTTGGNVFALIDDLTVTETSIPAPAALPAGLVLIAVAASRRRRH